MPRRSAIARASDSRVLQTSPRVCPHSSHTTVGHTQTPPPPPWESTSFASDTAPPADLAAVRVHRRYHAVAWEGAAEIGARRGADHDSCRAGIEPGARRVEVANATADAARCPAHHLADQPRVRALAERGVEVDDRHLPGHGELLEPGQGVAAVQHQVPAPS